MKKILLIGLALGVAGYAYSKSQKNTTAALPGTIDPTVPFAQYEGQMIADKDGYWTLVKNGKLVTVNEAVLGQWMAENPGRQPTKIAESFWILYAGTPQYLA